MSDEIKDVESPEEARGKEAKKVLEAFEKNIATLTALFKGPEKLKGKTKIPVAKTEALMEEVFAEEIEEAGVLFKTRAKALIKSKVALDKFVEQKTKEFNDAIVGKKKEMNKEFEECFAILENVEQIKKDFQQSVKA